MACEVNVHVRFLCILELSNQQRRSQGSFFILIGFIILIGEFEVKDTI